MSGRIEIDYDDGRIHESVKVAAEFTDWDPVPLGLDSGTRYAAVFDGAEAATLYHYKFIVDGQWSLLPGLETIHDRAGNVNHFAVAKPVPSSPPRNHETSRGTEGVAAAAGTTAVGGAGQFGEPAETAVRQAPGSSTFSDSPTRESFQDVTGFNPRREDLTESTEAAQDIPTAQLQSEPYEFVKETPGSFEANRYADQQAGAGLSKGQTSGYDYAAEFDRNPSSNFSGLSSYADKPVSNPLDSVGNRYDSGYSSKPVTGYEYTDSQLPKPTENILGGTAIGTAIGSGIGGGIGGGVSSGLDKDLRSAHKQPDTGYEYTSGQLLEPKEDILDSKLQQPISSSTTGYGSYDYPESKLSDPVEDIRGAGIDARKPNTGYDYPESKLTDAVEDIRGTGIGTRTVDTGYDYPESKLADPVEDIRGSGVGAGKVDTGYEYTESDLLKPKEKVAETPMTDDEYADAYEEASMPGSMPFERKVLGGQNVPANALDSKPTDFTGTAGESPKGYGNRSLKDKASADSAYLDSPSKRDGLAGEQSFYDSAQEQLEYEEDVYEETVPESRVLGVTGLPISTSDRTISKSVGQVYDPESGLDREAALRAVEPSTPPKERRQYEPESYATSYSPQHHQPIDVNTGFPIDHPEDQIVHSNQHRGHAPTLRNHEHRRSLKARGDRDPPPPPITSQEHRNAAVIAAASKASAFAKQDVAAIPGRGESFRSGQASPGLSRGGSVRSREQPYSQSRARDSAQFNNSPSSAQSGFSSGAPRQTTSTQAPAYSTQSQTTRPVSMPGPATVSAPYGSVSAAPAVASTTSAAAPSTAAGVGSTSAAVPSAGVGSTAVPSAAAGVGSTSAAVPSAGVKADSVNSSLSSEASQLQRTHTKKENRFKRLFKLH